MYILNDNFPIFIYDTDILRSDGATGHNQGCINTVFRNNESSTICGTEHTYMMAVSIVVVSLLSSRSEIFVHLELKRLLELE